MNFKKRIEFLKTSSNSSDVIAICNEALLKYNEYELQAKPETIKLVEQSLSDILVEKLKNINEPTVQKFLIEESYIQSMQSLNLGVKSVIEKLEKSDIATSPAFTFVLENLKTLKDAPEWTVIDSIIEKITPFKWNALVKECLNTLISNYTKNEYDIRVFGALQECIKGDDLFFQQVRPLVFEYLLSRDATQKEQVTEALGKYTFDENINKLRTAISELSSGKNKYSEVQMSESVSKIAENNKTKSSLKQRIVNLIEKTNSAETIAVCNEALAAYSEYDTLANPVQVYEMFETSIQEILIEKLSGINDAATKTFVTIEERIHAVADLGVRKTLNAIKESELAKNASTMYLVEALQQHKFAPEWSTIHLVIEGLRKMAWHDLVKESITVLESNAKKYAEDIAINNAINAAKKSKSNFVLSAVEPMLEAYLNNRTATNRTTLLENLSKFTYDANLRNLYNVILESEKSFQMKANSSDVTVQNVYSPVIINENSEIFSIRGKVYIKSENNISPLNESEYSKLPKNFVHLSNLLAQPNVTISNNRIDIYDRNQKISIQENEMGAIDIFMNERKTTVEAFKQVYVKSGILNTVDSAFIKNVDAIVENWHSIFELDFVKTIAPNNIANRKMDVFKLGHDIHINREDRLVKENIFYPNCNATQARHMVLEFTNYDLGQTFTSMLSEEEKYIKKFENKRSELLSVINKLQEKKNTLLNIQDKEIKESDEVQTLISILEGEIDTIKSEYSRVNSEYKKFVTVQESISVGDTVEFLKKKA